MNAHEALAMSGCRLGSVNWATSPSPTWPCFMPRGLRRATITRRIIGPLTVWNN